eukprot:9901-Pelagomonas_calceolata.AAC.1
MQPRAICQPMLIYNHSIRHAAIQITVQKWNHPALPQKQSVEQPCINNAALNQLSTPVCINHAAADGPKRQSMHLASGSQQFAHLIKCNSVLEAHTGA